MAERFWLLKSEPSAYSWEDLLREGGACWDGVRNHQAAANLRAMQVGERALFYHSGEERAAVGVVEVTRAAYPDPTDVAGRFVAVDVRPVEALPRPVSLREMKAEQRLSDMALFRQSRLSVVELTPEEWAIVLGLAAAPAGR